MNKTLILISTFLVSFVAEAAKPIIYPAKGQSVEQQNKDDGECYVWAKQNTGVDPANESTSNSQKTAQPDAPRGGVVKGTAVGAIIGGIGGNNVGRAATKGAVVGGVAQHSKRKGQQEAVAAQAQQNKAQQQENLNTYERAYGACMSARGYSVN